MRKITLFLSLLWAVAVMAQVVEPKVATDGSKTLYKFKSNTYANSFIIAQTGNADFPFKGATNGNAALFSFEATGEDGVYYIKSEDYNAYLSYNGVAENGNVGVKYSTTKSDTEKWKLIRKSANETAMAIVIYEHKDITDGANRYGLNIQGNATGSIVLWRTASGNGASYYQIEEIETSPVFSAITLPEQWQDGWYQIRTTEYAYSPGQANKYASCISSNNWIFTLEETNKNLSTLIYIYNDGSNYHMKSATGRYANYNATISTSAGNLTFAAPDEDKTLIKISQSGATSPQVWCGWNLNNTTPIIGTGSSNNATWRLQLSSADEYLQSIGYKAYTVNITNIPESYTGTPDVTCNKEGYTGIRTVFAGGTFFADDTITPDDFSASDITDYIYTVTITDNNTITVNYELDMSSVVERIAAELNKFGQQVGYPTTEIPENVQAALTKAQHTPNIENVTALQTAFNAIWGSVESTSVKIPEDGKVYRITGIMADGTQRYVYVDGTTLKWQVTPVEDASGLFICQHTAEGVKLASAKGNGLLSSDVVTVETLTGVKGTIFHFDAKKASTIGRLMLIAEITNQTNWRSISTEPNNTLGYYSRASNNLYEVLNNNSSTDFIFEEVTDYAGFATTITEGSNGNYGTLNLPFATVVPEGVTVNKVELTQENDEDVLNVTELSLTNNVLPAGTPVLLSANNANSYTFAPVAAQGVSSLGDTGLQGTLGAKAVTATAYILAKDNTNDEIKFFLLDENSNTVSANKAYYVPTNNTSARALSLNFGTTTGIAEAAATTASAAATYDLSGRQVSKTTRGLYIVGGKKVLVK